MQDTAIVSARIDDVAGMICVYFHCNGTCNFGRDYKSNNKKCKIAF